MRRRAQSQRRSDNPRSIFIQTNVQVPAGVYLKSPIPVFFPPDQSITSLNYSDASLEAPRTRDTEKEPKLIVEEYTERVNEPSMDEPPDGGLKAWSVIFGSALTMCATMGYLNAWGFFQAYHEGVMLPDHQPSDIAWIGSVQFALIFLPGIVSGRLFDMGYFKIPFFSASCLLILCTFLTAECTEYWQFFLAQGLGTGLACGALFGPAIGVVPHWFSKRRCLALSLSTLGTSVGGVFFPIAAQNLLPKVGFKWSLRILAFILIALLGVANLVIDRRLPATKVKGSLFNLAAFKNRAYTIYCLSATTGFLGLYIMLTYIPDSLVGVGIPQNLTFYLIAIANGSSALGRITVGLLADRIGAINILVPFLIMAAATTITWPHILCEPGLIALSVFYGIGCGAYDAIFPEPVMAMGTMDDMGQRTGLLLSFAALGALAGPPISGAIDHATDGFFDVGWFAGASLLCSMCLMLVARYLHLGKWSGAF